MDQPEWDEAWNDGVPDKALVQALTEVEENHPDLFDDGVSDEALLQAGGRFDFDLEPVVDRRSERMGVQERVFRTRVRQVGSLRPGQNVPQTLAQGLRAAMERLLDDEDIEDRDRVFFTLGSDRLVNNYNGWGLRAGEWRRNAFRVETMLQHLARMLNSNEQFEVNDSFQLAFVHVRDGPRGGGRRRRVKPGHRSLMVLRGMKRKVVCIPGRARTRVAREPSWRPELKWKIIRNGVRFCEVTPFKGWKPIGCTSWRRASREMRGCGTQAVCGPPEHVRLYDCGGGSRPVLRNVCVRIWTQMSGAFTRERPLRCHYVPARFLRHIVRVRLLHSRVRPSGTTSVLAE